MKYLCTLNKCLINSCRTICFLHALIMVYNCLKTWEFVLTDGSCSYRILCHSPTLKSAEYYRKTYMY